MTQPLALFLYERLLPGSQLVNRLQDLQYRVQTLSQPGRLVETAEECKPLLVFADLQPLQSNVCEAISRLKSNASTNHPRVMAFGADAGSPLQKQAQQSGVTPLVGETALLSHLPQFLEQA